MLTINAAESPRECRQVPQVLQAKVWLADRLWRVTMRALHFRAKRLLNYVVREF